MRTKLLSALALTAVLSASCSSDDDNNTPEANDKRVLFSSGVNAATSKVGGGDGDTWTLNDPIGIYIRDNAAGKTIVSSNIEYKATTLSNGDKNASFTSTTPIYYPVNTPAKVDFVAYHPYQSGISGYVYKVDLSSAKQANQSGIDLMRAYADGIGNAGYDKTNTLPVNLVFDHQLVKVIINVTAGTEVAPNLDNLTVNIKGMNTAADFAIDNPALSSEGTPLDITPFKQPSTSTFEAILLPVALTTQAIEFTVGGNTYKWIINNSSNSNNVTSLIKGKIYTFNVTLKKTGAEVTGTITPWESAGAPTGGTAN